MATLIAHPAVGCAERDLHRFQPRNMSVSAGLPCRNPSNGAILLCGCIASLFQSGHRSPAMTLFGKCVALSCALLLAALVSASYLFLSQHGSAQPSLPATMQASTSGSAR